MSTSFETKQIVSNPYTLASLTKNLLFSSAVEKIIRTIVSNMYNYAATNISSYSTITEIPREHTAEYLDTSTATNWSNAFSNCINIKSLPNPFYDMSNADSVYYMFSNCRNIKDFSMVNFGNKLTYMSNTFSDCRNLVNAPVIPNSVIYIYNTFTNCYNLVNAPVIPNSVKYMYGTFQNCSSLVNAPVIPNGVTYIPNAFAGCSSLVNAPVIPNGVTNMPNTFAGCSNLVNAPVIPNRVTSLYNTFYNCRNLINAPIIPNSIEYMQSTFEGCSNLITPSNIPALCEKIIQVYRNCYNLQGDIYIYTSKINASYNASSFLNNCNNYHKNIYVIENSNTYNALYSAMGSNTFNSNWNATLIPNLKGLVDYAQRNITTWNTMTSIPSGHLPEDITYSGNAISAEGMFYNCKNLTTLPNPFYNLANLQDATNMFRDCKGIKDASMINFGSKLLGMCYAFRNCSNLVNVPVIPNSVINMGWAFYGCSNLKEPPILPNSVMNIDSLFYSCWNLVNAPVIPNGVTDMSNTFLLCTSLVNAPVIPNSVKYMLDTFYGCYSLVNAPVIPNSVISMWGTFHNCSSLKNAPVIPNSVTNLSETFIGCSNLKEPPILPNSIIYMEYTFINCSNLVNAPVIPNSVNSIYKTFSNCSNLVNAPIIPNGIINMHNTFAGCSNLVNAPVIPNNVTNMISTFHNCTNLQGDIFIYSNNVNNATDCFADCTNYTKKIFVYKNTPTYNAFYSAMGNTTYNANWNAYLKMYGAEITFTGSINNTYVYLNETQYNLNENNVVDASEGNNIINCYNKDYGKTTITTFVELDVNQTLNITYDITNTSILTYGLSTNYDKSIVKSILVSYDEITFNLTPDDLDSNQQDTIRVPNGNVVTVKFNFDGYKSVTQEITVSSNIEFIADNLEESKLTTIILSTPFTDEDGWLTNLVDDSNFEINGNYIRSGSKSYNVNNGKSYGYIKFTTPDTIDDILLSVSCYTSSESNYDWGAVYVGTAIYQPSSYSTIKNKTTDGNGFYLYTGSGSNSSPTTYTLETVGQTLQPNTEYYISFAYVKDGSGNSNSDRFFISEIKFNTTV